MYAGNRCNSNTISTKRSNLDGVAPLITDLSPTRREARYNCDIKGHLLILVALIARDKKYVIM